MKNKFVLGIGGFMGSGKSSAGKYFADKGAKFIDADEVVNNLYKPGQDGYLKIMNFFGSEFILINGQINRKKLGKFVFSDPNKLKILNNLIHPLVTTEVQKIIDASEKPVIVLEAVYFEPKFLGKFTDKILWLECGKGTLLKRSLLKPGMTEELFVNILKTQSKSDQIDFLIENNGSLENLYLKLDKVWTDIPK